VRQQGLDARATSKAGTGQSVSFKEIKMSVPVMVLGESGSGKSASMRNMKTEETLLGSGANSRFHFLTGNLHLSPETRVALIAETPELAELASIDLREAGFVNLYLAEQGIHTLEVAGMPLVATPTQPPDSECIDYLFFVHDRHEGNREAARKYLEWENGLISQCAPDELLVFRLPV
jgi:hypothetical protein